MHNARVWRTCVYIYIFRFLFSPSFFKLKLQAREKVGGEKKRGESDFFASWGLKRSKKDRWGGRQLAERIQFCVNYPRETAGRLPRSLSTANVTLHNFFFPVSTFHLSNVQCSLITIIIIINRSRETGLKHVRVYIPVCREINARAPLTNAARPTSL